MYHAKLQRQRIGRTTIGSNQIDRQRAVEFFEQWIGKGVFQLADRCRTKSFENGKLTLDLHSRTTSLGVLLSATKIQSEHLRAYWCIPKCPSEKR